ncbi:sugar ABC transporter substrate-binding protein [Thiospirochaeta perfilievii]|uniref:Sugar ABC transporter substrate-binding protein n=1 Tax=Thiospirochaeta perfilievii TaxID=252967 RepID=A0A5C1QB94_9SPIO|nr:substrate-binding domain-containing protein [Thiospirochaeta perfilievii]QEN03432.1 sugar ABC transporter substrate-binding protein [Thiospirochaeta perfilievii]
MHARGLKKSSKHSFSVIIPEENQDDGYWSLVIQGIKESRDELKSLGTSVNIYHFDRFSSESCKEAFDKAINDDSIGLLITPVRQSQIKEYLTDCKKPYLFIDSDIPEIKNKLTYIGQDSRKSGMLSAKLMALLVGSNSSANILIIHPYSGSSHLDERIAGFIESIKIYKPRINITTFKMLVDRDEVKNFLKKNITKFDGIFVVNSLVYTIAPLIDSSIPLIGYDIIPQNIHYIEDGTIDFIITQEPKEQGRLGVRTLYDTLILKKEVNSNIIIPMNIITKENLYTF